MSPNRWLLTLSDRLYRLLLLAYPASFRHRYGSEMVQVFRDCNRDAYQQRGAMGLLWFWAHTLGDLAATAPQEYLAELGAQAAHSTERSHNMPWNTVIDSHSFTERLADVLDQEPNYYQLLVSAEPTRRMSDVMDSLALEGDPRQPETTLTLFKELGQDLPEAHMNRWLARLRSITRRIYTSAPRETTTSVTDKIRQLIYADPRMYELVAAAEPGYGLLEIIESLALEVNVDEIETMIELMHRLCQPPAPDMPEA
jgi:hypothetical protein